MKLTLIILILIIISPILIPIVFIIAICYAVIIVVCLICIAVVTGWDVAGDYFNVRKAVRRAVKRLNEGGLDILEMIKMTKRMNKKIEEEQNLDQFHCLHNWIFQCVDFTLGDKYRCSKCDKVKYQ